MFEREARVKYFEIFDDTRERCEQYSELSSVLVMRGSDTVILVVFEGYDQNSRASRSNTTYAK